MPQVPMIDLNRVHESLADDISKSLNNVVKQGDFINGEAVKLFRKNLKSFNESQFAITCGNGTDALQIALMALNLKQGDEIIMPSFSYVSTAEVCVLLGLKPVFVDVESDTFNINTDLIEQAITPRTKVIMPVHLFGHSADMEAINTIAKKHDLFVVEDLAQSLGTKFIDRNGETTLAGNLGDIGCTSFFPTKNLGCMGDGGAIVCNDQTLGDTIHQIANHGQKQKYEFELVGVNSRLDTMQAAILNEKIKYLTGWIEERRSIAKRYSTELSDVEQLILPVEKDYTIHSYNQYTIRVLKGKRDKLQNELKSKGIGSMIYYPKPLHLQRAYFDFTSHNCKISESMCEEVMSIPIYPGLKENEQELVIQTIKETLN